MIVLQQIYCFFLERRLIRYLGLYGLFLVGLAACLVVFTTTSTPYSCFLVRVSKQDFRYYIRACSLAFLSMVLHGGASRQYYKLPRPSAVMACCIWKYRQLTSPSSLRCWTKLQFPLPGRWGLLPCLIQSVYSLTMLSDTVGIFVRHPQ